MRWRPCRQEKTAESSKALAHWLFRTDYIIVRCEIFYDVVDIRKLLPGTRRIVLLLVSITGFCRRCNSIMARQKQTQIP